MRKLFCMCSCLLLGISLAACGGEKISQPQIDSAIVSVPVDYGECGGANGLYELGEAVQGTRYMEELTGEIQIEAAETTVDEDIEMENRTKPQIQPSDIPEDKTVTKMNVQVGDTTFTATLESNTAVNEFVQMMQEEPIVMNMSDYSGFEKVGSLGASLTTSNSQISTQSGDIVLYNGNQIVIFYGSHSWSYTRLGRIDDISGWEEALGSGEVQVTFRVIAENTMLYHTIKTKNN